jgi:hypothetical protein
VSADLTDPVCFACGCYRSAHEDDEGQLYCPPNGSRFTPQPLPANECAEAVAAEREAGLDQKQMLRAVLMAAAHCQGGHSDAGAEIADLLGLPFPLRMETLRRAATDHGFLPYDLWPWLERMEADRARSNAAEGGK